MLIISPEQLVLDGFETLASSKEFTSRCCCLGVDECHLLLTWGAQFRKPFQQIGLVRARLRDGLPLMALTATMRQGAPEMEVRSFLGLRTGSYHYIRQSNLRPDIRLIFREIRSPVRGRSFPELDWVLTSGRTTLIFCKTINFGSRVYEYLLGRDKGESGSATRRMRMYNSLNWTSYNETTQEMVNRRECTLALPFECWLGRSVIVFCRCSGSVLDAWAEEKVRGVRCLWCVLDAREAKR
jgi:hypothetical protein